MDFLNKVPSNYRVAIVIGACVVIAIVAWVLYNKFATKSNKGSKKMPPVDSEDKQPRFEAHQKRGPALMLVYAEWCGHCKNFMPTWDALTEQHQGSIDGVSLVKIDGAENPDVARAFGVEGFPTIIYAPNGPNDPSSIVNYEGDRNPEAIISFIKQQ